MLIGWRGLLRFTFSCKYGFAECRWRRLGHFYCDDNSNNTNYNINNKNNNTIIIIIIFLLLWIFYSEPAKLFPGGTLRLTWCLMRRMAFGQDVWVNHVAFILSNQEQTKECFYNIMFSNKACTYNMLQIFFFPFNILIYIQSSVTAAFWNHTQHLELTKFMMIVG